jgi:hypothetical protein
MSCWIAGDSSVDGTGDGANRENIDCVREGVVGFPEVREYTVAKFRSVRCTFSKRDRDPHSSKYFCLLHGIEPCPSSLQRPLPVCPISA